MLDKREVHKDLQHAAGHLDDAVRELAPLKGTFPGILHIAMALSIILKAVLRENIAKREGDE